MDMSPLPHKVRVPFSLAKTLAGSPGKTTVEDDMLPTATVVTPKVERRPFAQYDPLPSDSALTVLGVVDRVSSALR
jgi:hypothetical protein